MHSAELKHPGGAVSPRGPVPPKERQIRSAVARIRREKARADYLREVREFLLWMREKPRAFVVFTGRLALRK